MRTVYKRIVRIRTMDKALNRDRINYANTVFTEAKRNKTEGITNIKKPENNRAFPNGMYYNAIAIRYKRTNILNSILWTNSTTCYFNFCKRSFAAGTISSFLS
jgi:hypothetical protein